MSLKKKRMITIEDEILGPLKFYEDKNNLDQSYWEYRGAISFNINNDNSGISTDQRNYVKLIEKEYMI